jgi:ATP-dependent protease HslVU (ClpYQ) peptidase subunit
MTCIAGAVKDGEVCIGGDAISVHGSSSARIGAEAKVFRVGEFLIGSSGTVRCQQIIRYQFEPAPIEGDLTAYMVREFIPALRHSIKEHGGEVKGESDSEQMNARYLVSVRGHLYEIDSGYGVFESRAFYAAIGCAEQEALAAMFTAAQLLNVNASARTIVEYGLLAAAEFDTTIRPPFTILTLNPLGLSFALKPHSNESISNGKSLASALVDDLDTAAS